MNLFLVTSEIFVAVAFLFTASIFILLCKNLFQQSWVKNKGERARAEILDSIIMNDETSYLPYIKLKLRVYRRNDTSFISEIDSFISWESEKNLKVGGFVEVRYHPVKLNRIALAKDAVINVENNFRSALRNQLSIA